jgi:hypothetical protein
MMQVGLFGRPKKPAAPPTAPPVNLQRRSILGLTPLPADLPAVVPPAQPKLTPQQMEQAVKPQATFPGPHPDVWAGGPSFMGMGDLGDVVKRYTEKNYPESAPAEASPSTNPLQSLAGVGQTATNQLGQAGQNYATSAGNAFGAAGQAQASGYMGMANAAAGGLGQYMNYGQQQQQNSLLQQVLNRNNAPQLQQLGDNYGTR